MTVSNVVRGVRCVKAETAERVKKALVLLDYRSDPLLSSLSAYRSRAATGPRNDWSSLAFLDSDPSDYTREMFSKLADEASLMGYQLEGCELPQSATGQRKLGRRLYHQGVRGILLGPSQREQRLEGFKPEFFTMVSIGALHHSPHTDSVSQDYFQGLFLAAQKCAEHGYRNIGLFVGEWHDARTGHQWYGAYHAFCRQWKVTPRIWLYDGRKPPEASKFSAWVRKEKIEAVLTLHGCVSRFGRDGPKVRYVLLNDLVVPPGWWHLSIPLQVIAREGLRLLDDHLRHQERGVPLWPRRISIQGQWNG